jgi:hypothetical protein
VVRARTPTHSHLRDRLIAVAAISIVVDLIAAAVVLLLERHAPGSELTNYGDALFWTSAQLLTVSSQVHAPLTTGGRILDIALEGYAITVVAALAGSFAAFFHRRSAEREAGE